jgi:hypothetical protein
MATASAGTTSNGLRRAKSITFAPIVPEILSGDGQARCNERSGAVCVDHLSDWLREQLQLHRCGLSKHVEEQQDILLADFQTQCSAIFGRQSCFQESTSVSSIKTTEIAPPAIPISTSLASSNQSEEAPPAALPNPSQLQPESEMSMSTTINLDGALAVTPATVVKKELQLPRMDSVLDDATLVTLEKKYPVGPQKKSKMMRFSNLFASATNVQCIESFSEETLSNRIERLVESATFEGVSIIVICLNAVVIALEQQYDGLNSGYKLGYRSYNKSLTDLWSFAPLLFDILDKIFVACFVFEILLRIIAARWKWFHALWNYLDIAVVAFAIASWIFNTLNPSFVRLVRFVKLIRIMRVMRSNRLMESLKLLSASLAASFNTLCVSSLFLLLIHLVAALLLSQMVEPFINDADMPEDIRKRVFGYYGTFWRSMITMFEITFANWAITCRLLVDHVSEWFGLFFILYRCIVGFAMLSVIQAVFIQQTMKSAQLDDDFMVQQKSREKDAHAAKLAKIFERLDTSGDGQVSWDEFEMLVSDSRMKLLMHSLEVDVRDLEMLFHMLADDEGRISSDEFIAGLQRIKGPAQAFDLVTLLGITRRIEAKLGGVASRSTTRNMSRTSQRSILWNKAGSHMSKMSKYSRPYQEAESSAEVLA